jgi:hypothetical protein
MTLQAKRTSSIDARPRTLLLLLTSYLTPLAQIKIATNATYLKARLDYDANLAKRGS